MLKLPVIKPLELENLFELRRNALEIDSFGTFGKLVDNLNRCPTRLHFMTGENDSPGYLWKRCLHAENEDLPVARSLFVGSLVAVT